MRALIRDVDRLLRGSFTRREDLSEGRIPVPVRTLVLAGLLLGGIYGAFMGLYGGLRPGNPSWAQMAATTVKVPLLFLLTLAVTFPSLYVFSALSRTRLGSADTLRLLLAAIGVNLAVLASFGPVTGFFTLSTESYPFMVVLNVAFFAVAGFTGLGFLRRALRSMFEQPAAPPPMPAPAKEDDWSEAGRSERRVELPPPFLRPRVDRPRTLLRAWSVVFGIVGAQMGWILRPFVGAPGLPFELFRERESNFFAAFAQAIGELFR